MNMSNMTLLPQQIIAKSFDKACDTYDDASVLQTKMADELLSRLALLNVTPRLAGIGKQLFHLPKDALTLVILVDMLVHQLAEARLALLLLTDYVCLGHLAIQLLSNLSEPEQVHLSASAPGAQRSPSPRKSSNLLRQPFPLLLVQFP